jgi:NAD(P)-dependent dehydrogenase (short-subunit alcohol dehydrogenase family)
MRVLATGAARGIGAAMVRGFVEDGADVCARLDAGWTAH